MIFTQELVHFSNTTNSLLREYNQLHEQILSIKMKGTLIEKFDKIQRISDELKGIQIDFQKQFDLNEDKLPLIWKRFGLKLGEYLEVIVEHTYISDELITVFDDYNLWQRLWNFRKILNIFINLNKMNNKYSDKGEELNELINLIQNS